MREALGWHGVPYLLQRLCLWPAPYSLVTLTPLFRMLRKDKEEAEAIKHAKALEEEKAMYSVRTGPARSGARACLREGTLLTSLVPTLLQGRRSRRQRREFREKRLRGRKISPPR